MLCNLKLVKFKITYRWQQRSLCISIFPFTFLLAVAAEADGVKVIKNKSWRLKGKVIPEVLEAYTSVGAELNVMPFCSQFIPLEVINHPKYKSICYHPSILPRHRGASAISWWVERKSYQFQVFISWGLIVNRTLSSEIGLLAASKFRCANSYPFIISSA